MTKIAIVLPVYNGKPYLAECLASIFRQSFADFELWVGDDGSTDGSRELLDACRDPRMHRLDGGGHRGLFPNLNRLLRAPKSNLIRILCQDDLLALDCLEREVSFFEQNPQIAMSFCKSTIIDAAGAKLSKGAVGDLPDVMPPMLSLQHFFYHGCIPGNLSTVCLRKKTIDAEGVFDESYLVSGDYELWFRIGRKFPMGVIHRHLVQIRNHQGQLSVAPDSGLRFVVENRRIRRQIITLLPSEVQASARHFDHIRHDVLDINYALRSLLAGRWIGFFGVIRELGVLRAAWALVLWAWTWNNRRFRPQANWILPADMILPSSSRVA